MLSGIVEKEKTSYPHKNQHAFPMVEKHTLHICNLLYLWWSIQSSRHFCSLIEQLPIPPLLKDRSSNLKIAKEIKRTYHSHLSKLQTILEHIIGTSIGPYEQSSKREAWENKQQDTHCIFPRNVLKLIPWRLLWYKSCHSSSSAGDSAPPICQAYSFLNRIWLGSIASGWCSRGIWEPTARKNM